jgi:hypothetical protein
MLQPTEIKFPVVLHFHTQHKLIHQDWQQELYNSIRIQGVTVFCISWTCRLHMASTFYMMFQETKMVNVYKPERLTKLELVDVGTTQKTNIDIFSVVRTSGVTWL